MRREEILNKLNIKPGDIVLEIGPGNLPFWRSDIYLERDVYKNKERAGNLIIDRPLIWADAHNIPLADKSIDFVFCAQVLEHSENPEVLISEMNRIGRKGYIETPNFYRELMFGWSFHKWFIEKENDKLILYPNNLPQYFGDFFHKLQVEDFNFAHFCAVNFEKLNIHYEWEDGIKYEIRDPDKYLARFNDKTEKYSIVDESQHKMKYENIIDKSVIVNSNPITRKVIKEVRNVLKKKFSSKKLRIKTDDILKMMICPTCKNKFKEDNNNYFCNMCGAKIKTEGYIIYVKYN